MRAVVLTVVEHEGRYLLIREVKFGQTWYLPAGKVEAGESPNAAAVRETKEEAGIDVVPTGLLESQHYPDVVRYVYAARPTSFAAKSWPTSTASRQGGSRRLKSRRSSFVTKRCCTTSTR